MRLVVALQALAQRVAEPVLLQASAVLLLTVLVDALAAGDRAHTNLVPLGL